MRRMPDRHHADDDPKGHRPGGFSFTPQGVLHSATEAFRAEFQAEPQSGFAQCAGGANEEPGGEG
jgi:hypothetical protein